MSDAAASAWEGYLTKRGSRVKSWLRRYFVLSKTGVLRCALPRPPARARACVPPHLSNSATARPTRS